MLFRSRKVYQIHPEISWCNPSADSEAGIIKAKLSELGTEEVKLLLSKDDSEFESNYAAIMDAARQIGIDKYEEELNKRYEEVKADMASMG